MRLPFYSVTYISSVWTKRCLCVTKVILSLLYGASSLSHFRVVNVLPIKAHTWWCALLVFAIIAVIFSFVITFRTIKEKYMHFSTIAIIFTNWIFTHEIIRKVTIYSTSIVSLLQMCNIFVAIHKKNKRFILRFEILFLNGVWKRRQRWETSDVER